MKTADSGYLFTQNILNCDQLAEIIIINLDRDGFF